MTPYPLTLLPTASLVIFTPFVYLSYPLLYLHKDTKLCLHLGLKSEIETCCFLVTTFFIPALSLSYYYNTYFWPHQDMLLVSPFNFFPLFHLLLDLASVTQPITLPLYTLLSEP